MDEDWFSLPLIEPEERLAKQFLTSRTDPLAGPSSAELLARLVGGPVEPLAAALGDAERPGTHELDRFLVWEPESWSAIGLSPSQIEGCRALRSLWTRLTLAQVPARPLDRTEHLARYLFWRYGRSQEVFGVLYLDASFVLRFEEVLFEGSLTDARVDRRIVLRRALALSTPRLVLFHNHPSGNPSPSARDFDTSRELSRAAKVVGLQVMDHLILGTDRRYASLRTRGELV